MLKMILLIAGTAVGFGMMAEANASTIIRKSGLGDPYLSPASYSYDDAVLGSNIPTSYFAQTFENTASKAYPINDSLSKPVCGYDNGCTLLNSQAVSRVSDNHLGTVSVSAKSDFYGASATATLIYYFTVVGPDASSVPVTIAGFGSADAAFGDGRFATSSASIQVDYLNGEPRYPTEWNHTINTNEHNPFSTTIDVVPNASSYNGAPRIVLRAVATAGQFIGGNHYDPSNSDYYKGSASANIDPIISIADPKLASLYTIVVGLYSVSDPSAPVSPVPLPSPLPMFGAALIAWAGFGVMAQRRRTLRI